jgi:uncharacterized protein (TIGR03437 family)
MKNRSLRFVHSEEEKPSLSPFGQKIFALSLLVMSVLSLQFSDIASLLRNKTVVQPTKQTNKHSITQLAETIAQSPLSFEANTGQFAAPVKYLSRGKGYSLFLTADEAVLSLQADSHHRTALSPKQMLTGQLARKTPAPAVVSEVLKMRVVGGRKDAKISANRMLSSKSNYFVGSDHTKWRVNVPHYGQVQYEDVYQGVDLVYYGNQRQLEYDFVVQPGADPKQIKLAFEGVERTRIDANGQLVLATKNGELRQHAPVVYQDVDGARQMVEGHYVALGTHEIGFAIAEYDQTRALVIDPVLVYSTYLGGFDNETGNGIEADAAGNAYVTGITYSADFPTKNALQQSLRGVGNAWVAKFDPTGRLIYSTYLGGASEDVGFAISADSSGNAYVAGTTDSSNFPITNGAMQTNRGGRFDGFVAKLSANGDNLIYSTYLGGQADDTIGSIAIDGSANVYITGQTLSNNFPVRNAWQPSIKGVSDAYLAKLSADGRSLVYATYLGGAGREAGFGVIADSSSNAIVTGLVYSNDFPTRNPVQGSNGGSVDAFITKFNASGSNLVYSTYMGGQSDDGGYGVGVDSAGNAYVSGFTGSTNFPVKNAFQPQSGGVDDAYVLKLDTAGTLVYSTYLGGSGEDRAFDLAADADGNAYVAGRTESRNFPVQNAVQPAMGSGTSSVAAGNQRFVPNPDSISEKFGRDAKNLLNSESDGGVGVYNQTQPSFPRDGFIAKFAFDGKVIYITFLGGGDEEKIFAIAIDGRGNAYCTGLTASGNFPVKNPVQSSLRGVADAFVVKIADVGNTQATVSAASYVGVTLSPDQIVSSFGSGLALETKAATALPLPTNIQGTEVKVTDSLGVERLAPLFFVSPTQINFAVPNGTADGAARITVWNNGAIVSTESVQIAKVSPGIFSANSSGKDVLAGVLLRVRPDGSQVYENVARFDVLLNRYVPNPIEFGNDQVYLLLFGTGLRYRGGLPTVSANIGGLSSEVVFAGPQGGLVGLDQVNLLLSRNLAGRGEVNVAMTVDGKTTNTTNVFFK